MGYQEQYGELLQTIADEADVIAMRYFRAIEMRVDRKDDGSAVTQADRGVEEMARARVSASGLALDVLGEEMGGSDAEAASVSGRARLIIDPIVHRRVFSRYSNVWNSFGHRTRWRNRGRLGQRTCFTRALERLPRPRGIS